MTTSTDSAAAIGLPDQPFIDGDYQIAGNSVNGLPAGAHLAHITLVPAHVLSKPHQELFVSVDEAPGLCVPLYMSGPRQLVESWIVDRRIS
ncbi:hypothetical protein [Bosea sp. TAF32]|uniref:hypothetical protein n=1 Tax=Bosea sp. TAF32 TaxID=3237482 RepID=UPI003F927918